MIDWDDAAGQGGWNADEQVLLSPHIVHTVGMFLRKKNNRMLLCQNYCHAAQNNGGFMSIPEKMIRRVRVLKRAIKS